jgi:hypothetical protein
MASPSDPPRIKVLALIGLVLIMAACDKPLTNEEIVKQSAVCKHAGLIARSWHENFWHENSITRVECQP